MQNRIRDADSYRDISGNSIYNALNLITAFMITGKWILSPARLIQSSPPPPPISSFCTVCFNNVFQNLNSEVSPFFTDFQTEICVYLFFVCPCVFPSFI